MVIQLMRLYQDIKLRQKSVKTNSLIIADNQSRFSNSIQ